MNQRLSTTSDFGALYLWFDDLSYFLQILRGASALMMGGAEQHNMNFAFQSVLNTYTDAKRARPGNDVIQIISQTSFQGITKYD
jgi:hypothetical protein